VILVDTSVWIAAFTWERLDRWVTVAAEKGARFGFANLLIGALAAERAMPNVMSFCSWQYTNRGSGSIDAPACSPGSARGLRRLVLSDKRYLPAVGILESGEVGIDVSADGATTPAPVGPVRATIVFGGSAAAGADGNCGVATLSCVGNASGTKVTCQ